MLLVHRGVPGTIAGLLKFSNQGCEPRRQDNQVSSAHGFVRVGDAGGNEYRSPGTHVNHAIDEAKPQRAIQHMPRLVIGAMDMQSGRATSAPLVAPERPPNGRKTPRRVGFAARHTRDGRLHDDALGRNEPHAGPVTSLACVNDVPGRSTSLRDSSSPHGANGSHRSLGLWLGESDGGTSATGIAL